MSSNKSGFTIFLLLWGFLSSPLQAWAQDTLRFAEAAQIALENNFGIQVAKKNAQTRTNNATRGNAGLLPTVTATGNLSYANNNTKLQIAGEQGTFDINQTGASTFTSGANITANYTLFDGWASLRTFQRLKLDAEAGQVQVQQTIESVLLNLANAFFTLARQTENLGIAQESVNISRERLLRAQNRNDFGQNNRLAVLNAEVDLNTDSIALVSTQLVLENTRRTFNQIMGRDLNTSFAVSTETNPRSGWNLDTLLLELKQSNALIRNAQYNQALAELDLKIAEASRAPRLNLSAGYAYNRQKNEVGLLLVNRNYGLNLGASLSFDIYGGGRKNLQIQNAQIGIESRRQQYQEALLVAEQNLRNAFATYQNRRYILEMETRNLKTAEANFTRTQELFNFGQSTSTAFREAQLNLIQAKSRRASARFDTQLSEIELLQISGKIIEELP
ncbi:MAG: TolC family protein [Microscillaceae bacterium]|nr:TolC family protein [Microscillaceae bacterium]